jgi:predicted transcriptional regulator of viral defense system
MLYRDFVRNIQMPIFTSNQAEKILAHDYVNIALARWEGQGVITRLKQGLYIQADVEVDEMLIANYLYKPSYVSLETILNQAGIIPDIPSMVTSIVTGRPRKYTNTIGTFAYSKLPSSLFFGYEMIMDNQSGQYLQVATPEKAILDWMYVRRVRDLRESRIEWGSLRKTTLLQMAKDYPQWMKKEINKYV